MSNHHVNETLSPVTLDSADERQQPLLKGAQQSLGFIPNMYANMATNPGVLSTYLHGYADFREHSGFSSQEQEVVFLAISLTNGCSYCGAAHSMLADKVSGVKPEVLAAIREGKAIPDDKLQALYQFVVEMVDTQGKVSKARGQAFRQAGYGDQHVTSIILAIAVKTLSNYSNHFFEPEVDAAFSAYSL